MDLGFIGLGQMGFHMARRLIEAGARVVTLNYSKWDWHGGSYNTIFNREAEDHSGRAG